MSDIQNPFADLTDRIVVTTGLVHDICYDEYRQNHEPEFDGPLKPVEEYFTNPEYYDGEVETVSFPFNTFEDVAGKYAHDEDDCHLCYFEYDDEGVGIGKPYVAVAVDYIHGYDEMRDLVLDSLKSNLPTYAKDCGFEVVWTYYAVMSQGEYEYRAGVKVSEEDYAKTPTYYPDKEISDEGFLTLDEALKFIDHYKIWHLIDYRYNAVTDVVELIVSTITEKQHERLEFYDKEAA
jgi:hypothetical protein